MCRNASLPGKKKLKAFLGDLVKDIPDYAGAENVNSFDHPDVPVMHEYGRMDLAIWGLAPEWVKPGDFERAKELMDSNRNAVSETIFERRSYEESIRRRRCIMFIDGIHEWQHQGRKKIPYYVTMQNADECMAVGAIWCNWKDPNGNLVKTCSMITTAANPLMSEIHNSRQRQPHILQRADWEGWLAPNLTDEEIRSFFRVFPDRDMKAIKKEETKSPHRNMPDLFGEFNDASQW